MKAWIKNHKLEIAVFVLALLVRTLLFSINLNHNEGDFIKTIKGDDGYYEISQNLIQGNGFSYETAPPYTANPLRPPVWPYTIAFLAGLSGYWLVFVFEIIIGSLIPVLSFLLAKRFLDRKYASFVGFFMAVEPLTVLLSFILYTETMFTFLFLLFLLFLFRYIENKQRVDIVWMGVFFGLATLVKPTIQYFPIIVPIILIYLFRKNLSKRFFTDLLLFIFISVAILFPWFYRNKVEFGVWGMSAQPAFNLYVYLVPSVLAINNGTSFSTEIENFVRKDGFDEDVINLSNSHYYSERAIDVIKEHKKALVKSVAITVMTFFTHDGMLTVFGYAGLQLSNIITKPLVMLLSHPGELVNTIVTYIKTPLFVAIVYRLFWILSTLLFIWGSLVALRDENYRKFAIPVILIVFYFAFTTAINGLGVNARFRVPVNPLIISLALFGFSDIKSWLKKLLKVEPQ